jgi:hypothetical protein
MSTFSCSSLGRLNGRQFLFEPAKASTRLLVILETHASRSKALRPFFFFLRSEKSSNGAEASAPLLRHEFRKLPLGERRTLEQEWRRLLEWGHRRPPRRWPPSSSSFSISGRGISETRRKFGRPHQICEVQLVRFLQRHVCILVQRGNRVHSSGRLFHRDRRRNGFFFRFGSSHGLVRLWRFFKLAKINLLLGLFDLCKGAINYESSMSGDKAHFSCH